LGAPVNVGDFVYNKATGFEGQIVALFNCTMKDFTDNTCGQETATVLYNDFTSGTNEPKYETHHTSLLWEV
jgi:hypothetical protein